MSARLQLPDIEPEWTPRQREVLDLLVRGRTNGEIAAALGVSLEGAKFHVSEILSKLQVTSREEAAEYWRHRNGLRTRFLRVGGGLFSPLALKWLAGGVAAAVVVAAAIGIAVVAFSGGDGSEPGDPAAESPSPVATTTNTPTPAGTASQTAGPSLTPFPTVTAATGVSVPPGATITGGYGLLFGNPNTGGVEAWLLPQNEMPEGVSPEGRYFVFGRELIDAWTGARTTLDVDGDIRKATFAPDDSAVVVMTSEAAALFGNDGSLVLRFPPLAAPQTYEAMWSGDSRAVALSQSSATEARVDVVVDGVLRPAVPSTGMTAWSHEGLRLAVTGERPAIYDYETGKVLGLQQSGTYPAWSHDDAYVAVDIGADGAPGLSTIDAATGEEVMRLYNRSACFLIYWYAGPALSGVSDTGAIAVPSGDVIPYETVTPAPAPRIEMSSSQPPLMHWVGTDGKAFAEVSVDAMWAYTFAWVRRDIDTGFPPVLFLGRGGQDACGGQQAAPVVAKPPFTPDQVPTPTPTPDK